MKKTLSVLLIIILVFSLASCGEGGGTKKGYFNIVTTFYPVYVTTLNIVDGADRVTLTNMTDPETGCLHNYILTPEDMKLVSDSNLVIASGLNMESFVGNVSFGIPGLEVIDCGEDAPNKIGEYAEENPHYWMNIDNAIAQCEKIRKGLCRVNPENAAVYNRNAGEYTKKLNDLKKEAAERTSKLETRDVPVIHDSFEYFASAYGLNMIRLLEKYNEGESASKQAEQIAIEIKRNGIDTIFVDEQEKSGSVVRSVEKETKCKVVALDMLTVGEEDENPKDAYLNAIRGNLDLLEENLGIK